MNATSLNQKSGRVSITMGVVFRTDSTDPSEWSGIPAGLARAFEEYGLRIEHISAKPAGLVNRLVRDSYAAFRLPRSIKRVGLDEALGFARSLAETAPAMTVVRTWTVRRRIKQLPRLDAVVQVGSEYFLADAGPLATFEDITVAQAVQLVPEWQTLSSWEVRARIRLQQRIYEAARACCVSTDWAAQSIIRDYGVPPDKVRVVGVGRNHDVRPVCRSWDRPRFLVVASNWRVKNGETLLRAFSQLKQAIPDARLDVVGRHPRIDVPGVVGHGHLRLDRADDRRKVTHLFEAATCFLMPSRYEAAGIAYTEAAAAGIPSIGTTVGGAAFVIGPGGKVVDPEDELALLGAMIELSNPEVARRLGGLAMRRAPLFTWKAVAGRILRALDLPGVPSDALPDFL